MKAYVSSLQGQLYVPRLSEMLLQAAWEKYHRVGRNGDSVTKCIGAVSLGMRCWIWNKSIGTWWRLGLGT